MNNRFSFTDDRSHRAAPEADGAKTAHAIAELFMLEECIQRCETLAAVMAETSRQHPILPQLSECISACGSYLAAKARESSYQNRHAALCKEILTATAAACRKLENDAAIRCRMSCEIALGFLEQSSKIALAGRWN